MTIRLHHVAQARSFRVLWLLEELGLDYELRHWSFFDRSMRGEEFRALSPAARVPALEIDGRVLFESGAISEYLLETRPHRGLLRPPGDAERADWLQWLHFAETIAQHIANLTQHHIVLREPWMRSPTVMRLEAKRLEKVLEVVDAAVERHDWLLPSGFTAVDVAVGYGAVIARRFVPVGLLPALDGWRRRLEMRPAYRRAAARDGVAQIYRKDFYPPPQEDGHG